MLLITHNKATKLPAFPQRKNPKQEEEDEGEVLKHYNQSIGYQVIQDKNF